MLTYPPGRVGISGGNTAGDTGTSFSNLFLAGGNNLTVSGSTSGQSMTVTLSAAAGGAASSWTVSDNATSSTVARLAFTNLNGVTLSLSSGSQGSHTIVGSHNGLTSQSTQFLALTLGGNTAGTTTFHATNNVSLFLNGGNNVTLSGNGSTVTISAANQTVQTQGITADQLSVGVSTGGNTAGNTTVQTGNRLVFVGSNGITLSQGTGAGSTTLTISGVTVPAQLSVGDSNIGNTSADTGVVTGRLVLAGGNNITLSGSTNAGSMTITISAPNLAGGAGFTAGVSTGGSTAGDTGVVTGRLVLAGSNITMSGSTNAGSMTVTVSGYSPGAVIAGGNTYTLGELQFDNANGVSFGLNDDTLTASVAAQTNQSGNLYAVGNTTGTSSGTYDARTLSLSAGSGLQAAASDSGWVVGQQVKSFFEPFPGEVNSSASLAPGNVSHVVAFNLPYPLSASFIRIPIGLTTNSTTLSTAAASLSGSATVATTYNAVVYSVGTGASSRSLISVASGGATWGMLNSISVAANGTQYSITQSLAGYVEGSAFTSSTQYSISNTNYSYTTNQIFTNFSGNRFLDLQFTQSLAPGPYWMIWGMSTSSNSNSARVSAATNCNLGYASHWGGSVTNLAFGIMGSTNLSSGAMLGGGSFSTAGGGTTSILPISAISSSSAHFRPYFRMARSA